MSIKIMYVIICQSDSDIDVIYASFSKRKRDKVFTEKCLPLQDNYNLFYQKEIIINSERWVDL